MGYSGVGSDVFSSSVQVLMNISHIDERNDSHCCLQTLESRWSPHPVQIEIIHNRVFKKNRELI